MKLRIYLIGIVAAVVLLGYLYVISPAASESRAESSLNNFISKSNIVATVASCTPDSDGDGYASCSVMHKELMSVQCTSGFMVYVPFFGSKSCKVQGNEIIKLK